MPDRPEAEERWDWDGGSTPLVTIGMSLGHAKAMVPVLEGLIAQYEERFGPVPNPTQEQVPEESK